MSIFKLATPQDIEQQESTGVEGEIRNFVRRDLTTLRNSHLDTTGDLMAANVNSLVQRVAKTSAQEIDKLIVELQTLRDYLQQEGERVQNEVAGYARLSQSALASTKVIAEGMAQWKSVARPAADDEVFAETPTAT